MYVRAMNAAGLIIRMTQARKSTRWTRWDVSAFFFLL